MSPVRTGTRIALLPAQAGPTLVLVLLAPVVPGIAAHFGAQGVQAAQQIVTFPFLGLMAGSLLCGLAIHWLGLRRLMQLSFAGWLVSGAIGLFAGSLPLLLGGSALLGLSAAFFTSCLAAMTAILFDDENRPKMVGIQSGSAHIIGISLTLAAAALANSFGWRMPFVAIIAFAGYMLVMTAGYLPNITEGEAGPRVPLLSVLARIWPLCLAGASIFLLMTNESTHLPFLLESGGMESAGLRSLVTTATPFAGIFGAIIFTALRDKLGDRSLILFAGISASCGWLTFWLWPGGLPIAMAAAGLTGLGLGVVMPMIFSHLMQAVPGEEAGTAMGLLNVSIFFGSFMNPAITFPLREMAGLSGMFAWLALGTMLLCLTGLLLRGPSRTVVMA